jgi:kynurenine formamidase
VVTSPQPVKSDRNTEIVDLSLEIRSGMPVGASLPSPIVVSYADHEEAKAEGLGEPGDPFTYAVGYASMLDHVGTHVDAPLHMGPGRASIDEMPLDWFTGRAVCLDLRHVPDLGDVDVEDMTRAEEEAGLRVDGHIVLLCTGFHARHWPNREVLTLNPGLTAAATHWLADRNSRAHGVEGPSTDRAGAKGFPSHRACRDRSIIHYEWLVNLERLVGKGEFQFAGYPLKWAGGTASPVRAIAELPW